mgnify:CR=1 FL=1
MIKKNLFRILILLALLIIFASFVEKKQQLVTREIPQVTQIPQKPIIFKPVTILPKIIMPGDPIMITSHATSTVTKITYDGKSLPLALLDSLTRAFVPVDFNEKNFKHEIKVYLSDGSVITEPIIITQREKIERPLGIPEKLGGNTPAAEKALVDNLAKENAILAVVKTDQKQLWSKSFDVPLNSIFVTDDYGYDRKTVGSTIVHKGTDFRAQEGTEVKVINDGVVKIAREFTVYGNTIVVDHGQGIQSFYMHLSRIDVKVGDIVKAGQVLGLSGKTGYAEAAHLHLSIKINAISIDPMTFLRFFTVI